MVKKFFLLFLSFLMMGMPRAYADEMTLRNDIQMKVANLFWQQDFVQLDEMARAFREEQSRTPSGVWKLTLFYRGLSNIISVSAAGQQEWESVYRISDAWAKASPDSPPAQISKAIFLKKFAEKIRGTTWAHEVPKEAWAPFFELLAKAENHLLSVKETASKDPEWYIYMSSILIHYKRDGDKRDGAFEKMMAEAFDRHPGYYQLYAAQAEYLFPKWHGDISKMEDFANDAVKRTKDTEGMGMYARIYWVVSQWNYGTNIFTDSGVVWPRMKQGILDVLKKYPDQWNINNFAMFACLAKDREMTKDLIQKIETPAVDAWRDMNLYESCKAFAGLKN